MSQLETEMRLYLANPELAEQEEAARVGDGTRIPWYFTQGRKAKQVAKVKLVSAKPSHFPNPKTS